MEKYSVYGITLETYVVMFVFFLIFLGLVAYGVYHMKKVNK
ncbi:hypothetical protein [Paenibacillus agricola]|nr:hypothetical protein [Paenibacillus agricola]